MKRSVRVLSLILTLALSLSACGLRSAPASSDPTPIAEAPAVEEAQEAASAPEPSSEPEAPAADPAWLAAEEALLDEYRGILPFDPENYEEAAHPEIPWYSALLLRFEEQQLYYGRYDFDGNGTDELVMAVGSENYQYPIGVYAFDGEKMVYLCKEQALGERASVSYADGIFTVCGSGGAASGVVIDYRIGADGFSTEILRQYEYEYQPEGEVIITSVVGDMDAEHFDETHLYGGVDASINYLPVN